MYVSSYVCSSYLDARQQRPSVAALAVILAIVPVMAVVLPMPTARCAAVITARPVAVIAVGIGVWCVVVIAIVAVVAVTAIGTGVAVIATIAVGARIDVVMPAIAVDRPIVQTNGRTQV